MKKISDILNIEDLKNLKKDFNQDVTDILNVIKTETKISLREDQIIIKKNTAKIKSDSNVRFVILLHMNAINEKLKSHGKNFSLEL